MTISKEEIEAVCKKLTDEGKIIEAGWVSMRQMVLDPDAPQIQLDEMRMAFFGGAHHTFISIMTILEPGTEATENDIQRMGSISDELDKFITKLELDLANKKEKQRLIVETPPTLGDAAPIEKEYRVKMQAVAHTLDEFFNGNATGSDRTTGFVLLLFPFGEGSKGKERCNFISNGADRKDIVVLFKEMIQRFSGQPDITGHA
jgi:hypothetical protein